LLQGKRSQPLGRMLEPRQNRTRLSEAAGAERLRQAIRTRYCQSTVRIPPFPPAGLRGRTFVSPAIVPRGRSIMSTGAVPHLTRRRSTQVFSG
jgi:hypothetical protein